MDYSIGLKELQIVSGALREGDEELQFYFYLLKDFFGWGEDGVITLLFKGVSLGGLGKETFFGGMGTIPRQLSWMAWEREVWFFFEVEGWGLFFGFLRNSFFGDVGWVVGERVWVFFSLFFFFFHNMVA